MSQIAIQKEIDESLIIDFLKISNPNIELKDRKTFIELAKAFNLNPFMREIYLVSYKNKQGAINSSIIVGYEVYIKRAERTGLLNGWQCITDGTINYEEPQRSTMKAIITIHRKDFATPFIHEVYFSEYFKTKLNFQTQKQELTEFWRDKPITMIKKVAIGQGFRLCFPNDLGGLPYLKEELGVNEEKEINPVDYDEYDENDADEVVWGFEKIQDPKTKMSEKIKNSIIEIEKSEKDTETKKTEIEEKKKKIENFKTEKKINEIEYKFCIQYAVEILNKLSEVK